MPSLTEQDCQEILSFLQGLNASLSFDDFAAYVRDAVPKLIPAEISVFGTVDFGRRQAFAVGEAPIVPEMEETFCELFDEHPFVLHQRKTFDFSACKLSDFWTETQLHQSEAVYHRFMRYLQVEEVMSLSLLRNEVDFASQPGVPKGRDFKVDAITLFRGERSFTERDRTILNLLQPHLMQVRQTTQTWARLHETQQKLQSYLNAAGSIVLNQEGRVQAITHKAETLLKRYFSDINPLDQGLPDRLKQWVKYQRSLLTPANDQLKPLMPLRFHCNGQQLTVRYVTDPAKEQHLLLLEEQQPLVLSIESLRLCGLSQREAEVLFWVAEGKTNPEIATQLHLSVQTVRKHLEHIYSKLAVQTRSAAVVVALKQLGLLTLQPPETVLRPPPHQRP